MYCYNHPERSGANTCSHCGRWLCAECSVEVNGRILCKSCINEYVSGGRKAVRAAERPTGRRHVNWGLLFVFSFILPGINYMYEGLIKRGLFSLSITFLLIYVASVFNQPLFACVIGILWITCIFDGFNIRRRINAGEYVEDGIGDIQGFLVRNKNGVMLGVLGFFALSVLSSFQNFMYSISHYAGGQLFMSVISLIIMVAGVYFIIKAFGRKSDKATRARRDEADYIDERHQ